MEPSLFAGVRQEIKTKSESFIVSDKEFVEISGLISQILIYAFRFSSK